MPRLFSCVYIFFFALKAKLQVLKFEFCQIKLTTYELATHCQKFAQVGLQLELAFKLG